MEFGKVIKTYKSKKGNDVVFRYPTTEDFFIVWKYACDLAAEDTFVELSGLPPGEDEERKWFEQMITSASEGSAVYLHVYINQVLVGSGEVSKGKYRRKHVGHLGISLAPQYREEGVGTELMKLLIEQSKMLGIRLIELSCYENNPRALHVYEKLGFQKIGIMPNAIAWKGGYVGEVKMYLPL